MVLNASAGRVPYWLFTGFMLMFIGVGCVSAWVAAGIGENPEARAMFVVCAAACGCLAAVIWDVRRAVEEGFLWHVVDGMLFGEWKPGDRTASLPLSGPLRIDLRVLYPGDDELETVEAVAGHESDRFGRVELLSEMVGGKHSRQQLWTGLELRSAPLAAAHGERLVLPCGWTARSRSFLILGLGGVLLPFVAMTIGQPVFPIFLSIFLVVLAFALVRSMASIELRRSQDGIQWRRALGGRALGRWKRLLPASVLDLTRYPMVEWRAEDGSRSLRIIGGSKGVRPEDALRATEWMRQHERIRLSRWA